VNQYISVIEKSILVNFANTARRLQELENVVQENQSSIQDLTEKMEILKHKENVLEQRQSNESPVRKATTPPEEVNEEAIFKSDRTAGTPKTPVKQTAGNLSITIENTPTSSHKSNQCMPASKEKKKIDEYFASTKAEPVTHTPTKSERPVKANEEELQDKG
jgi:TolA-binding protein